MTDRRVLQPGPDHPITIAPAAGRAVVTLAGQVIADSRNALSLREANYPMVLYVPRADVDMAALNRTDHTTWCPYKGEASYYSVATADARATNAVWSYETPHDAVAPIKDHLAFYPDRVDAITLDDDTPASSPDDLIP